MLMATTAALARFEPEPVPQRSQHTVAPAQVLGRPSRDYRPAGTSSCVSHAANYGQRSRVADNRSGRCAATRIWQLLAKVARLELVVAWGANKPSAWFVLPLPSGR